MKLYNWWHWVAAHVTNSTNWRCWLATHLKLYSKIVNFALNGSNMYLRLWPTCPPHEKISRRMLSGSPELIPTWHWKENPCPCKKLNPICLDSQRAFLPPRWGCMDWQKIVLETFSIPREFIAACYQSFCYWFISTISAVTNIEQTQ
jgi:hypothetical protein